MSQALDTWKKKLEFLQQQEAIASDPAQKFTLAQQIAEAQAKIAQLSQSETQAPTLQQQSSAQSLSYSPAAVDFVIITPLEEEREAMLAHLGQPRRLPPSHEDVRVYYAAMVPVTFSDGSSAQYNVVLTDLLGMGRLEAANAVGDAIRRWQPSYILLVGIAGGLSKAGVNVGDVLISEQIADYELQKLTPEKAHIRWSVHRADPRLLVAAKQMRPGDWQPLVREPRPAEGQPKRHAGPICTGDKVIANGLMDDFREVWTKLIGVEMEAGGVASAALQAANAPGFFMVRGVSDLADAEKDMAQTQSWRAYACDVAAAYVEAFLRSGPIPARPAVQKPIHPEPLKPTVTVKPIPPTVRTLRELLLHNLSTHFNLNELEGLCFALTIDFESIEGGSNRAAKARNLILYLERHNRLNDLIAWGQQNRPDVPWAL